MKNLSFYQLNQIADIIFIDGLARCGKSLLSGILPCFNKVEQLQFISILEHVLAGLRLKKIEAAFAEAQMKSFLNQSHYDGILSRNLNLRRGDQSSIYNNLRPNLYLKRLRIPEGDKALKYLKKEKLTFLYQVHDLMANYSHFEKLRINCRIIEVLRNPIDLVYSWYTRGWGKRFGKDQRAFTILLKEKKNIYPWYTYSNYSKYKRCNEVEKCALNVLTLTKLSVSQLKKIRNRRNKILIIKFEDFVENPISFVKKFSIFLNKKYSKFIHKKIKEAKCPRKLSVFKKNKKKLFLKKRINKKLFNDLLSLEKQYLKNTYNLF